MTIVAEASAVEWLVACPSSALGVDDVIRFDRDEDTYAIYRTESGLYATDGICTHQRAVLADGLVMDDFIECPVHQGRFYIPTGEAKGAPVCVNLTTHPVREEGGYVLIGLRTERTRP